MLWSRWGLHRRSRPLRHLSLPFAKNGERNRGIKSVYLLEGCFWKRQTKIENVGFEIIHIFIPGVLQEGSCFEDRN